MKLKPIHCFFGLLLIGTAVPSLGGLKGFTSEVNAARSEAKRIGQETTQLTLSQQEATQKAAIANQRYQQGCIPVVSPDQSQYVTLVKNKPVVDNASKAPLPAGSVVCDAHGNTAMLVDDDQVADTPAVAQAFAFTGDKAIIQTRLNSYQGAAYSMPQN